MVVVALTMVAAKRKQRPKLKRHFYAGQINSQTSAIQNISLAINLQELQEPEEKIHIYISLIRSVALAGTTVGFHSLGLSAGKYISLFSPRGEDCLSEGLTVTAFWPKH